MTKNRVSLELRDRRSVSFDEWITRCLREESRTRLCFAVSGYESRSSHWARLAFERVGHFQKPWNFRVVGFVEKTPKLNRTDNDRFFERLGVTVEPLHLDQELMFLKMIRQAVEDHLAADDSGIEVHIDYSSMPRAWYCGLPFVLEELLRPQDQAYFWYSGGEYPNSEYPTAGVDDFLVFSGQPTLAASFRSHILGLGFDRIRANAIWSVLDPQNLIAFFADPATKQEYVHRAESANEDVLRSANHQLRLPIKDISVVLDRLISLAREFRAFGDVIFVPDGPKPFILACSVIPALMNQSGVVCFHVRRRNSPTHMPVDVTPIGNPDALVFSGPDPR